MNHVPAKAKTSKRTVRKIYVQKMQCKRTSKRTSMCKNELYRTSKMERSTDIYKIRQRNELATSTNLAGTRTNTTIDNEQRSTIIQLDWQRTWNERLKDRQKIYVKDAM